MPNTRISSSRTVLKARGKLNLGLRVFEPRDDGMHPLETVFQRIELHDTIEIIEGASGEDRLTVQGKEAVPNNRNNLVLKAVDALRNSGGDLPPLDITLTKRIPVGGGLGGGSSDAAAILRFARSKGVHPRRSYHELAVGLGADVPFFLLNESTAQAMGIGDNLRPIPPLKASVLLAVPPFRVSTQRAYERMEPRAGRSMDEAPFKDGSPHRWESFDLTNDFAVILREEHEEYESLEKDFRANAEASGLTGSGSVLYGLYKTPGARDRALRHLTPNHSEVRWITTRLT